MFDQYRLKPGDTLRSVAKKFETNESTLKDLNNILKFPEILLSLRVRQF